MQLSFMPTEEAFQKLNDAIARLDDATLSAVMRARMMPPVGEIPDTKLRIWLIDALHREQQRRESKTATTRPLCFGGWHVGDFLGASLWSACLSNVATTGGMERLLIAVHQVALAAITGLVVDLAHAAGVPLDKPLAIKNPERN